MSHFAVCIWLVCIIATYFTTAQDSNTIVAETTAVEDTTAYIYLHTCQAATSCCSNKKGYGGFCQIYEGCHYRINYDWKCGNLSINSDNRRHQDQREFSEIAIPRGSTYNVTEYNTIHTIEVDLDGCIWLDGDLMLIHSLVKLEEFLCIQWDGWCSWECAAWICSPSQRCYEDRAGTLYRDVDPECWRYHRCDKKWNKDDRFGGAYSKFDQLRLPLLLSILLLFVFMI
mmetsp:Transcript_68291/g.108420  ORF Transcript_68291/g.108420 Transcript_68291/m.108420 type:complete len:228 (+) Transcript_68291:42-725(+)